MRRSKRIGTGKGQERPLAPITALANYKVGNNAVALEHAKAGLRF